MIRKFLRLYFKPTLTNWRSLRRVCMAKLPKPRILKKEPANG